MIKLAPRRRVRRDALLPQPPHRSPRSLGPGPARSSPGLARCGRFVARCGPVWPEWITMIATDIPAILGEIGRDHGPQQAGQGRNGAGQRRVEAMIQLVSQVWPSSVEKPLPEHRFRLDVRPLVPAHHRGPLVRVGRVEQAGPVGEPPAPGGSMTEPPVEVNQYSAHSSVSGSYSQIVAWWYPRRHEALVDVAGAAEDGPALGPEPNSSHSSHPVSHDFSRRCSMPQDPWKKSKSAALIVPPAFPSRCRSCPGP